MKTTMKSALNFSAGMLLLTTTAAALACEPQQQRPGQAAMDTIREQAMAQLRSEALASLQPRIARDLVAAVQLAAPRHMIAAGMPLVGRSSAAP
ncbi:MAG: hypothetical protein JWQ90_4220 [Hydrocarboniphaga sp.]|uniref:hypothetical protein n=1 Tax=Hydrocarboniphaga sp. TaxID=2033016 RepID=UPI002626D355|nr:hypothetical protein [Hydrocarboniphaga sp.]MDB5971770.1 hypothetical protein [Hydrocarboniphaga sp.]